MGGNVAPGGGLLSQLIAAKSQQDQQALTDKTQSIAKIAQLPGISDDFKQFLLGQMSSLVNAEFDQGSTAGTGAGGSGGKGKSSGGGSGGGGGKQGIGNVFANILQGLTLGVSGAVKNYNQRKQDYQAQHQRIGSAIQGADLSNFKDASGKPGKMFLSDEDKQALALKLDAAEQEERAKIQEKYKRQAEQDRWEDYLKQATAAGYSPKQAFEQFNKVQAKQPSNNDIAFQAYADKTGKKVEDLSAGDKIQAIRDAATEKKPEAAEPAHTRELEDAYRAQGQTPDEAKKSAASDITSEEKKKLTPKTPAGTGAAGAAGISAGMSDADLKMLARRSLIERKNPAFGLSANNPLRERYQKALSEIPPDEYASLMEKRTEYQAAQTNLSALTKIQGTMKAGVNGTNLEIDRLKRLSEGVNLSQFKNLNELDQYVNSHFRDDPKLAAFREALTAARYRYNSMISSVRGGGAATNQVRTETAEEVINRAMARGALNSAADEMKIGLKNVLDGVNQAVSETQDQIKDTLSEVGTGTSKKPAAADLKNMSTDDLLKMLK
jgi:hypothetical protein